MLRLRALGEQLALFGGLSRALASRFFRLLQINHKKEEANDAADAIGDEGIHRRFLEVPQKRIAKSDVHQRQHGEGVAERLVHDVPEMEHFLRTRKEEYSLGERGFFGGGANRFFQFAIAAWVRNPARGLEDLAETQARAGEAAPLQTSRITSRIIM